MKIQEKKCDFVHSSFYTIASYINIYIYDTIVVDKLTQTDGSISWNSVVFPVFISNLVIR